MGNQLRHKDVAVAVIFDEATQSFLLWHNKSWYGYAFPMKQFTAQSQSPAAEFALRSLKETEFPLNLTDASANPIERVGDCVFSETARQFTYYDYHVLGIDLGQSINRNALHPDLRYYTYEQLMAAQNVTSSTKSIASALVEDRHVAVAVIPRCSESDCEFLLVFNPSYRCFFPAARLKNNAVPVEAAMHVVRSDLGYDGRVEIVAQGHVDRLQQSTRFGLRKAGFHFHLCRLEFPDEDLWQQNNGLEQALMAVEGSLPTEHLPEPPLTYWQWITADEMRTREDLSPSVELVLSSVLQLVEACR